MAEQKRLFLWAVPRSISTAFFRAMMNRTSTKVLLEPYSSPYYFGPERISTRYEREEVDKTYTFKTVTDDLEQPYAEYDTVFVKDMAYYLVNKFQAESVNHLPKNYIHTFIMRDPHKSVYSLYKMSLNRELTGWDHFDGAEVGFKELYNMFEIVTKQMGQEAIVIDADDLLKYPETMLRLYCDKVGIQFQQSMIDWDDNPKNSEVFKDWMPWFEGVLTSSTFKPSATKPKSPLVMPDLPRHVQRAIDENMQYYNKMHAVRLRPNLLTVN